MYNESHNTIHAGKLTWTLCIQLHTRSVNVTVSVSTYWILTNAINYKQTFKTLNKPPTAWRWAGSWEKFFKRGVNFWLEMFGGMSGGIFRGEMSAVLGVREISRGTVFRGRGISRGHFFRGNVRTELYWVGVCILMQDYKSLRAAWEIISYFFRYENCLYNLKIVGRILIQFYAIICVIVLYVE